MMDDRFFKIMLNTPINFTSGFITEPSSNLRLRAEEQIEGITAELADWKGHDELPDKRDLTSYKDAYASACKNCTHRNYEEVVYLKEYLCTDCNRYMSLKELRKAYGI